MPTVNLLRWRPQTETPEPTTTAIIALYDADECEYYLAYSVHEWTRDEQWVDQANGQPLSHDVYLWLPETELLAPLADALLTLATGEDVPPVVGECEWCGVVDHDLHAGLCQGCAAEAMTLAAEQEGGAA